MRRDNPELEFFYGKVSAVLGEVPGLSLFSDHEDIAAAGQQFSSERQKRVGQTVIVVDTSLPPSPDADVLRS